MLRAALGLLRVGTGSYADVSLGAGTHSSGSSPLSRGGGGQEAACWRPLQVGHSSAPCSCHPSDDALNSALAEKSHSLNFLLRPLKMTGTASQNNHLSGAGKKEAEPSSVVRGPPQLNHLGSWLKCILLIRPLWE